MKKLIMTAAVVACASIVSAQVVSDNIVGYVKLTTPAPGAVDLLNIAPLTGSSPTVSIQDAIVNLGDLNATTSLTSCDKIYVWTGSGYNTYGLYAGTSNFWMSSAANGWNKAAQAAPSVAAIERGAGVWYQTSATGSSAQAITIGEVPEDGTYNFTTVAGVDIVTYPYSATINFQDLVVAGATATTSLTTCDKIYVWTGSGYNTYGLYAGTSNFWMSSAANGWNKAAQAAPSNVDLPLGKGVWFQSAGGAKTIGFTQNY